MEEQQRGLSSDIAAACRRVGVDARIIGLISWIGDERTLTAETDTRQYVGIRPSAGQVAVYLNSDNLDLRLDPGRARALARQHGWSLTGANQRTGTLRVSASQIGGEVTEIVRDLIREALDRSLAGPDFRNERGDSTTSDPEVQTCRTHIGYAMLGGKCDLCE